jgi:hypothetical protein
MVSKIGFVIKNVTIRSYFNDKAKIQDVLDINHVNMTYIKNYKQE